MKTLKLLTLVAITTSMLAGCQTVRDWAGKRDNGSLEYQKSELLTPIELPATQDSQPFVKMYPTVDLGDSTVNTTNKTGTQFALPAPQRITSQ